MSTVEMQTVPSVFLYSFLSSTQNGGELSALRPGRFTPGKKPSYLLTMRLGGTHSQSRRCVEGKSVSAGIRPRIIQPLCCNCRLLWLEHSVCVCMTTAWTWYLAVAVAIPICVLQLKSEPNRILTLVIDLLQSHLVSAAFEQAW